VDVLILSHKWRDKMITCRRKRPSHDWLHDLPILTCFSVSESYTYRRSHPWPVGAQKMRRAVMISWACSPTLYL